MLVRCGAPRIRGVIPAISANEFRTLQQLVDRLVLQVRRLLQALGVIHDFEFCDHNYE